jgi:hypothetical protein
MGQSARVTSIEAIKEFRASLCRFGVDAKDALCATELEIRRLFDWLERQHKHWLREVRVRQEEVVRAKNDLIQRKYSQRDGRGPGYTEQEIALEKSIKRLREAEFKVDKVRQWGNQLPRHVSEYEGPSRQLAGMLDADLAQAIAILEDKINALEAYAAMAPPSAPSMAAVSKSSVSAPTADSSAGGSADSTDTMEGG